MKLTKYEHACFAVEKDGKLLVVDPGVFTTDLPALESVVAVVITHEHPDHFDGAALGAIVAHNPDVIIYAHKNVVSQLGDALPNRAVVANEGIEIGPFRLEFYGGEHATIHTDIPAGANLGVMINGLIYYPGDSFTLPERPVDVLALPVSAPWMKQSESVDFLTAIKPRLAFPTHDAILSQTGKGLADRLSGTFAEKIGTAYQRLPGPLEING
ncbi:MAG: MBL fold metallo-hydrolase [Patescibacteria group bacterium]